MELTDEKNDCFVEDETEEQIENESLEYIDESNGIEFSSFENANAIPMDLSVEGIISWNTNNKLLLSPDFQRREVWDTSKISLFIESLILNVPIPSVLLAQNTKENVFIVIDGKQRLNSIIAFWAPEKEGKGLKLRGLNVLKELNGYNYYKLKNDPTKKEFLSRFENYTLRANVLKNYDEDLLYFIFSRLNSGSVPLSTQELRQAMYPGDFVKYANDFSMDSFEIRQVLHLKKPDKRMRDAELVIRYFAYKYFRAEYQNSINKFFNKTCASLNAAWEDKKEQIIADTEGLSTAIQFVLKNADDAAFRTYFVKKDPETGKTNEYFGPFNRPMFDLMTVVFSEEKYRQIIKRNKIDLKEFIKNLFRNNDKFADAFLPTTHSKEKTETRFCEFLNALTDVRG